jgi:hypothetical protein
MRVFNQTLRPEAELLLLLQGKFRKTELEGQWTLANLSRNVSACMGNRIARFLH